MTGNADNLREQWADVKTPWGPAGNRRTYSVGTIEVRRTETSPGLVEFSEADAIVVPDAWPVFNIQSTTLRRQVVMLQCVDETQNIQWQRFFYGQSGTLANQAANARAVSVWPALTEEETRVAICGEVFDEEIPLANYQGVAFPTPGFATGFIAVYNGGGDLLWTHHLFVPGSARQAAVTDLSIRREAVAPGSTVDVVTYCGVTTHGTPSTGPLAPVHPFTNATAGESNGATNVGAGQWDGFVGQVECGNGVPRTRFHSTVSATGQNGLFGLAEMRMDRFVVVGSTLLGGAVAHPGTSQSVVTGSVTAGVILVFDAAPTRQAQPLQLEGVRPVGDLNGTPSTLGEQTHLRDVAIGFNAATTPPNARTDPRHMIYVVGSTNHDLVVVNSFAAAVAVNVSVLFPHGASDGLLLTLADVDNAPPDFRLAGYIGGPDEDGLTGVGSWSEYGERFTLTGWTGAVYAPPPFHITGGDILVESWFEDVAAEVYPPTQPPSNAETITRLRSTTIGGTTGGAQGILFHDRPCGMGKDTATVAGGWVTYGLGDPAGGGVAVDARTRATVVGVTYSSDYPVEGGGRPSDGALTSGPGTRLPDAVRSTMDLLPLRVGRTDGSGDPLPLPNPPPQFDGGTTPACGLAPFGIQIGGPGPGVLLDDLRYPPLLRVMLDYEGPAPDGVNGVAGASVVMVRPPSAPVGGANPWQQSVIAAALRLGLPQPTILVPELIELWTLPDPLALIGVGEPNQPIRQRLVPAAGGAMVPLPPGMQLTVQLVCLVSTPVPSGMCGPNEFTTVVASPAIWIDNN